MKIGIDARIWGTRHAGIGRYVEELVKNLKDVDKENKYVIFCRKKDFDSIPLRENWEKKVADIQHYSLQEQLSLPKIFRGEKLDILHVPHFNVPIFYDGPFIVTIHDILWHQVKGPKVTTLPTPVYGVKYLAYRLAIRRAVSRSKKIIVPSKAVKSDLIERFKLNKEKIKVIYEGVTVVKDDGSPRGIKRPYPYLLYVGSLYPHKNVETLVRAVKSLVANRKTHIALVVVCGRDVFWERFRKFVKSNGAERFVKLIGYISDNELIGLYKNAQAFVFPTLSEGFGLPALEAMAQGTPVVCSDIPVLQEIYGDAALYFNPREEDDIIDKLRLILMGEDLRSNLIEKGKKRVARYSWRKMAEETLKVYKNIV